MARESNRTHTNPVQAAPRTSNRPQPQHEPVEQRESNRTFGQIPRQPREQRVSNRTPQAEAAGPVQLEISDGPASTRVRSANQYNIGDIVHLHSKITEGSATGIRCTVSAPDGTSQQTLADTNGNTTYHATTHGQHWYAFDAYNQRDQRVGSAEQIFLVARQHVNR